MANEELSDTELFDAAVTDQEEGQEQQVEQTEQSEQETAEQATLEAEKQQVDDNAPQVPSWRVREINEEKRRLADENERFKAELVQLRNAQQRPTPQTEQKKPERADPLLDPEGYAKQVREDIRNELLAERREESLQRAAEEHPDDFKAAYAAAQQARDPALNARMQASRDPGKTLLAWHREQKTMQEVGNDPNAWLEKKLEERLKDPTFLAKAVELARGYAQPQQQTNGRPRVELPPTLSSASRAQAAAKASDEGKSDFELFQEIAGS